MATVTVLNNIRTQFKKHAVDNSVLYSSKLILRHPDREKIKKLALNENTQKATLAPVPVATVACQSCLK
jgi:hypothetical protein